MAPLSASGDPALPRCAAAPAGRLGPCLGAAAGLFHPLAILEESAPAGGLAALFTLHVLLTGLAAEADDRRVALRILPGSVQQVVIFRIQFGLMRQQLGHQRRAGFAV